MSGDSFPDPWQIPRIDKTEFQPFFADIIKLSEGLGSSSKTANEMRDIYSGFGEAIDNGSIRADSMVASENNAFVTVDSVTLRLDIEACAESLAILKPNREWGNLAAIVSLKTDKDGKYPFDSNWADSDWGQPGTGHIVGLIFIYENGVVEVDFGHGTEASTNPSRQAALEKLMELLGWSPEYVTDTHVSLHYHKKEQFSELRSLVRSLAQEPTRHLEMVS